MQRIYIPATAAMASLMLLSACVDDSYDLSDIDTSMEVKVNDLVIPVNLGTVTLNSIIDVEESGSITKEPYRGNDPELQGKDIYVYNYNGSFNSDPIHINSFTVEAPEGIEPSTVHAKIQPGAVFSRRKGKNGRSATVCRYSLGSNSSSFQYDINDVDKKIKSVDKIGTPKVTFATTLVFPDAVMKSIDAITLKDVRLRFPEGLSMKVGKDANSSIGEYDSESGVLTIPEFTTEDSRIPLVVTAEIIDTGKAGVKLENNKFDYDGTIDVIGGEIDMELKEGITDVPQDFDVTAEYDFSSFVIDTFSGEIDYELEGLEVEKARLEDLPDFLTQDETRIRLANPQLYLSIYNSCAEYDLGGVTGLSITPIRGMDKSKSLAMESQIVVGIDKGTGPYKYAISPEGKGLDPIDGYSDAERLPFSTLGDVLYGEGLPDEVEVDFTDPRIDGTASGFPLRVSGEPESEWNIPSIKGEYTFRAPLALADGSQIVYSGTEDGWDSEELRDLYVSVLEVTADVTSTVPLEVKLSASLVDTAGSHLGKCEAASLPAMARSYPIAITITPDAGQDFISDIDGIFYKAWAISTASGDVPPLSPDQTLRLDNIRVKVSGKYVKLDDDK